MGSRIGQFRRKIALGQYELTSHAKEELEQDDFTIEDVKSAIYSGIITGRQRHEQGVTKYLVVG